MRVIARDDGSCPSCLKRMDGAVAQEEPKATLAGQRHALAIIALAMPAVAVILETRLAWIILGSTTILLATFAAAEIRASQSFTGLNLTRAATVIGSTVLLLAVASYVREELSPGGRPGVMAAIRAWGGTLSWATAALALGLKGIDRVLTGDQKARLADVVLRTWNWLDDQRRANYPKLLWRERTQRVILWVSASVFVFIQVWAYSAFIFGRVLMLDEFSINRLRNVPWTYGGLLAVIVFAVVLPMLLSVVIARSAYRREHVAVMQRVMMSSSISAYFALLVGAVIAYSPYLLLPAVILVFKAIISVVSPQLMFMVMLAQLAVLWPVVVRRNTEGLLLLFVFLLSLLFITVTMYARILIYTAERVVAIVLENKDGVVVGVSTLLIAVGAVLKLVP